MVLSTANIGSLWELSAKNKVLTKSQIFFEKNSKLEEIDKTLEDTNYILFLDDCLMHSFDYKFGHQRPQISINDYFTALDEYFTYVEKKYHMPVIIAGHPNGLEYEDYKNFFRGRKVFFNHSAELSEHCFFAMTHYSLSAYYPILAKKNLVFLDFNKLNEELKKLQKNYCKILGSKIVNIQDFDKKIILNNVNYKMYNNFIENYICSSKDNYLDSFEPLINHFKG